MKHADKSASAGHSEDFPTGESPPQPDSLGSLSRRAFINASMAGSGAALLAAVPASTAAAPAPAPDQGATKESSATKLRTEGKNYDVVVVGGGPAGVAAGLLAARQGLRAIVLEKLSGKDGRIGRFATYDMGGVAANLGTQVYGLNWHPLMREAMESFGMERLKERGLGKKVGTWWDGKLVSIDHKDPNAPPMVSKLDPSSLMYALGRDALRHFESVEQFVVQPKKGHERSAELAALDKTPVSEYLKDISPDLVRELNAFTRMAGEGNITQVSSMSFVSFYAGMTFFPDELNGVYIADGGNHLLHLEMIKLLEKAGGTYVYNTEARKITQDKNWVTVACGAGRTYHGRYAVSATTPQVMLKTIEGLPATTVQALKDVTASTVAMVGLRTRGEPFGDDVDIMLYPEDDVRNEKLRYTSFFRQDKGPGGVVYTGVASDMLVGNHVDAVAKLSDEQLLATAVEQIRLVNPAFKREDLLEHRIERFDWCVVHPKPGYFTGVVPRIGTAHRRVHFAGDFLSPPAISGAYGSAEVAVKAIVAAEAKRRRANA